MEGMCRPLVCADAQTEDVAEDAGRADGGCSTRQPPGGVGVWQGLNSVASSLEPASWDSSIAASSALARG